MALTHPPLRASNTEIAETPPPTSDNELGRSNHEIHQQKRLEMYDNLFGSRTNNDIDQATGLKQTTSLNYQLQTFLYLQDDRWLLAMIDIDGLADINEKLGYSRANKKINEIGTIINQFCGKLKSTLKGFKCNNLVKGKGDLFAVLIHCDHYSTTKINNKTDKNKNRSSMGLGLELSEKYMKKLMKRIKLSTNETVSIGIAKMNKWDTFEEWKQRS